MNSPGFKDTACRICLDENVALDWNNTLNVDVEVTYKECYYKYTHLRPLDSDPFSSMLCQKCLNGLETVHALVLRAIDSHNFFLEVNCTNFELEDSTIAGGINGKPFDIETVIIEESGTECLTPDHDEYENLDEFFTSSPLKENSNEVIEIEADKEKFYADDKHEKKNFDHLRLENVSFGKYNFRKSISIKSGVRDYDVKKKLKKNLNSSHTNRQQTIELKTKSTKKIINGDSSKTLKLKPKHTIVNTPSMCSFCSKILANKYALQKHEKTHIKRERKATCPICGVKYFDDAYLKAHMKIHNENREKKHKCEFCDKSFYERGGLNVHRRIHLGQMIPCSLCPKEFFRQVDLDIHMNCHSATVISAEKKKRSRYWVRCTYCHKSIMSTSFKSHTAAHLNEPLMKCAICNKGFFRRDSCRQHLKTIHHKTVEEYNDCIITYNKNRLSHLYLEQKADIEANED